jgi:hypothetical protein
MAFFNAPVAAERRYLARLRIACSRLSGDSANIRSPSSSRIIRIDGVKPQCASGSGFSHAVRGQATSRRYNQTAPAPSFQCSTLPPKWAIS